MLTCAGVGKSGRQSWNPAASGESWPSAAGKWRRRRGPPERPQNAYQSPLDHLRHNKINQLFFFLSSSSNGSNRRIIPVASLIRHTESKRTHKNNNKKINRNTLTNKDTTRPSRTMQQCRLISFSFFVVFLRQSRKRRWRGKKSSFRERERETAGCAHSGVSYKGIEREKEEEEDGGCWEEEREREWESKGSPRHKFPRCSRNAGTGKERRTFVSYKRAQVGTPLFAQKRRFVFVYKFQLASSSSSSVAHQQLIVSSPSTTATTSKQSALRRPLLSFQKCITNRGTQTATHKRRNGSSPVGRQSPTGRKECLYHCLFNRSGFHLSSQLMSVEREREALVLIHLGTPRPALADA